MSRSRALMALALSSLLVVTACGGTSGTVSPAAAPTGATSANSGSTFTSAPPTSSAAPVPDAQRWHPVAHLGSADGTVSTPSGLIFQDGTYHAFYRQQAAAGGATAADAPSDWAHATSTDLVHWTGQPVALPAGSGPDSGDVLSGSIVVDTDNTSGFGDGTTPPMVAVYTSTAKGGTTSQSVAYSTDHGQTWQQDKANPVLDGNAGPSGLRDPKVFWYQPGGYWVMTVADPDGHAVQLYRSANLRSWQELSTFGKAGSQAGNWQSPDLFPLPLDGNPGNVKWVLMVSTTDGSVAGGSGVQYFVGTFDGTTFDAEPLGPAGVGAVQPGERHSWLDWGPDLTGATTFQDAPAGRRVALGWLNNSAYAAAEPTAPWNGEMTIPRELTLTTINGTPRLTQQIATEAQAVLSATPPSATEPSVVTSGNRKLGEEAAGTALTVDATLVPGDAAVVGVSVLGSSTGKTGTRISYSKEAGVLQIDRSTSGKTDFSAAFVPGASAPVALTDGKLQVRIVVDGSSVEVFAGGVALSALVFPQEGDTAVAVFGGGGKATVANISVTPLSG